MNYNFGIVCCIVCSLLSLVLRLLYYPVCRALFVYLGNVSSGNIKGYFLYFAEKLTRIFSLGQLRKGKDPFVMMK